ncbi:MAG: hypothetical protein H5T85_09330, partial [Actinobacteria bacterium]|nr:hypothetical protein [Actinomycetota bacterium]
MGIEVLPPDINESYSDFTVVGNSIRFGLSAIKNVGVNVIEEIEKERKKGGKFKSFSNFCERIDNNVLNKKTIESLIKSGTFDSLGQSRKYLMENFEKIVEAAQKLKMDRERGQFSLFDMGAILETGGIKKDSIEEIRDKTKKDKTNQGRAGQVGNGLAMFKDDSEEYPQRKLLNFEKEMLGLYVSGHPLLEYKEVLSELCMIENLYEREDRSTQIVGGVITRIKSIFTKDGKLMYFVNLEDVTDSVEVIVFPTVLEKYKEFLIENKIVKVKGKLDKKEDQIKIIASEIEELSRAGGKYGNGFNGSGYFNSNTHTEVTYKEDVNIVGENQARAKTKNETKSESKSFRKII